MMSQIGMNKVQFLFWLHLWGGGGGGEELYTQMFFFVQTILADRYIHCREIWEVSFKSSSNAEFEIKKIFFIFVYFEELSRFKEGQWCLAWFYSPFYSN